MRYWNRNLITSTESEPTSSSASGIFDLTSQLIYKNASKWPATQASSGLVTTSLIVHLDAGDTNSYPGSGTTWTDLSGNNNDGTLVNGPTFNSANGGSIEFDGTNDDVTLGTQINSAITETDITVSFWTYLDTTSGDRAFVAMNQVSTGSPLVIWHDASVFSRDNTGAGDAGGGTSNAIVAMVTDTSSSKRFSTSSNALSANTWHNVAVVLDVTNNAFYTYIDGAEDAKYVSTNTSLGLKSTSNSFDIGGASYAYLDGRIAHFLVYTKALTASEVLQNYNALSGRF